MVSGQLTTATKRGGSGLAATPKRKRGQNVAYHANFLSVARRNSNPRSRFAERNSTFPENGGSESKYLAEKTGKCQYGTADPGSRNTGCGHCGRSSVGGRLRGRCVPDVDGEEQVRRRSTSNQHIGQIAAPFLFMAAQRAIGVILLPPNELPVVVAYLAFQPSMSVKPARHAMSLAIPVQSFFDVAASRNRAHNDLRLLTTADQKKRGRKDDDRN